jgi:hypothetical protein
MSLCSIVERVNFWSAPYRSQQKSLELAGDQREDLSPCPQVHGKLCRFRQRMVVFAIGCLGWKQCAEILLD